VIKNAVADIEKNDDYVIKEFILAGLG